MPMIDITATAVNIKALRKNKGLKVRDIQEVFGFATPQAIYKWENGTALPSLDNLVILATLLKVKMDDIIVVKTI